MKKKLTFVLVAILVFTIGFSTLANNTTAHAQTQTPQEEMQLQIDELRELVNMLVSALLNNNQAGIPGISSQLARDIAIEFVGHGTTRDVLLFTENGVLIFEVEVRHEDVRYMVYIIAANGNVLRMSRFEDGFQGITTLPEIITPSPNPSPSPSPSPSPGNDRGNRPTNPAISLERAIEIAQADLARRGISATFRRDSGMDWERNQWVWELEFRPTTGSGTIEYYINVNTGAIVKFEWDR